MVAREESGVLKLVHPGRFVELHRRPVAASEVMAKNPRHFVARPDVFRYPWIVVRPESLLMPGQVFYIVPHNTLRRLIEDLEAKAAASDDAAGRGLKPCLKKGSSSRSSSSTRPPAGRRVAFVLPVERK